MDQYDGTFNCNEGYFVGSTSSHTREPSHPPQSQSSHSQAQHDAFRDPVTVANEDRSFTLNLQPNTFSYDRNPANASIQNLHHQNPQESQSSYQTIDPCIISSHEPNPLATNSSLPNQGSTGALSAEYYPRKKRKRGSNGRILLAQAPPSRSESIIGPHSADGLTTSACLLYLICHNEIEPPEWAMRTLSLLYETPLDTIRGIFGQFGSQFGCVQTDHLPPPTENTPHQVAVAACGIWQRKNPGKWPTPHDLNYLEILYRQSYDSLENYFKHHRESTNFEDSGNWSKSDTAAVEEAAKMLWGNHNMCVKKGDKWERDMGNRRRLGRDPNKKYLCVECWTAFGRKSDFKRHEAERCLHQVWLCCIDSCRPDKERYWKRKSEFKTHAMQKHPNATKDDLNKCHVKISGNFRRHCILENCHAKFRSFDESFKHIRNHMDSNSLDLSQIRSVAGKVGVSEHDRALEDDSSDSDHSSDNASNDSEDGDDGPPPPNAGHGSASGQFHGGYFQPGSGNMQSPHSSMGNSGSANNSRVSSKSSRQALHLTQSPSLDLIRNSIPSLWSLDDFLRTASPASPKLDTFGQLGYGSNAVIDEVKIHGFHSTMARKTFRHIRYESERQMSREVESMSKLQHTHVVKLVSSYRESSSVALLMCPVANYNLSQYLATCSATSSERRNISLWFGCLSSGLEYIHEHGVYHFDIKPSNILVKDENVLFTDFGASTTIAGVKSNKNQPIEFTKLYAAPEMLKGERRAESDVFSLGCVFLEMVTVLISTGLRQRLRRHQQQARRVHWAISWKKVLHGFAKPGNVQHLLEVFDDMFRLAPDERPTAAEVKNKINAQKGFTCEHYMHNSVQEYVFHVPQRAFTWPPDRAVSRPRQAKSDGLLPIISEKEVHFFNENTMPPKVFMVQHGGLDGLMMMTMDMHSALPPVRPKIRPGVREARGIDIKSMMMPYLHYRDTHEQFRVYGISTKEMKVVWANLCDDLSRISLSDELRDLMSELSAMSVNDNVLRIIDTNDDSF